MRSQAEFQVVWALIDAGLNNRLISILTGISRATIRDWRRKGPSFERGKAFRSLERDCPSCAQAVVPGSTYAYLLGLYLGDGCISAHRRGVYRLRVTLDLRYSMILEECSRAIREVRPSTHMRVGRVSKIGCIEITAYWKHWPCLFPQNGAGPKHQRRIQLQSWQEAIVEQHPDRLLRG